MGQAGTKTEAVEVFRSRKVESAFLSRSGHGSVQSGYRYNNDRLHVMVGLRCSCALADWALMNNSRSSNNGKLEPSDAMVGKNDPQLWTITNEGRKAPHNNQARTDSRLQSLSLAPVLNLRQILAEPSCPFQLQ